MSKPEIWGITEIAQRYDISPNLAHYWSGTKNFPKPAYRLANGRVWFAREVRAWVKKNRPKR